MIGNEVLVRLGIDVEDKLKNLVNNINEYEDDFLTDIDEKDIDMNQLKIKKSLVDDNIKNIH